MWQWKVGGRRMGGGEWRNSEWEVAGWCSEEVEEVQSGRRQEQGVCSASVGVDSLVVVPVEEGPVVAVGPAWWRGGTGRGSAEVLRGMESVKCLVLCRRLGSWSTGKGTGKTEWVQELLS